MKIETKYNIGDKVAIERNGEMSVMTIDEVCATKVTKEPVGISYSGVETVLQRTTITEDAISYIYSRAEATKTDTLANGIYIKANNQLHTPEDWAKQADPTTALSVVLITDFASIEIAKNDLVGEFKFDDAQKACTALDEGWRCPTRHEAIEMYDARFKGLDEALKLIGGTTLAKNGWRWTCEADTNPEYSSDSAFFFNGSHGGVDNSSKYYSFSVRPVRFFKR